MTQSDSRRTSGGPLPDDALAGDSVEARLDDEESGGGYTEEEDEIAAGYTADDSACDGDDDLRVVQLCFLYGSLHAVRESGRPLTRDEREQLRTLERLLLGDPTRRRRRFRRIATLLPATLRTSDGKWQALVVNISGGGMYVTTPARVSCGSPVQVRLGTDGAVRFVFPCVVQREDARPVQRGLALTVTSVPLRVEPWQADEISV